MPKAHKTARLALENPRASLSDVVAAVADIGCLISDSGSLEGVDIVIVDASRIGACVTITRPAGGAWSGSWARLDGPVDIDPITQVFGEVLTGSSLFAVLLLCGRGDLAAADAAATELLTARGTA